MKRLENKVTFITGAASGMGQEISRVFFREDARVILSDINEDKLAKIEEELSHQDRARVFKVTADVRDSKQVDQAIRSGVDHFGRLDIVANVAGVLNEAYIKDFTDDIWDNDLKVMLYGPFYGTRAAARYMIEQGEGGCIINISSTGSIVPLVLCSSYCVAKAGVNMLTKVAAVELGSYKIRVNAIAPGETKTPLVQPYFDVTPGLEEKFIEQTPLGRLGETSDIANAALFLASDEADWITGHILYVDGGQGLRGVDLPKEIGLA